jgi:tetratricopeptide (TPR) repeat protein
MLGWSTNTAGRNATPIRISAPGRIVSRGRLAAGLLALGLLGETVLRAEERQEWERQVRLVLDQGDLADARSLAEQRLKDPHSAAAAGLLLGIIDLRARRHADALGYFQAARQLGMRREELFERWSEALAALGRVTEACQMLEEELRADPSWRGLHSRLAELYEARGKPRQALPHLEEVYRQGVRNAAITLQLAAARFAVGQDYRAVELLDQLAEPASSPNLLLQIGKLYFRNLLYRQALVPLKRVWDLADGRTYEIGMLLALAYYQLEQYTSCAPVLEQIEPSPAQATEYYLLKGSVLARMGPWSATVHGNDDSTLRQARKSIWDDAQRQLERAVASDRRRADGYLNLGLFWFERGDRRKAWELLEKGARLMTPGTKVIYRLGNRTNCDGLALPKSASPGNRERADIYAGLAEIFHKTHYWISALELFQAALEEDDSLRAPYGAMGLICQELGSPEVGEKFLQRGIELHPGAADLRFYLGTVQAALGRNEDSLSSYLKALELDGPNPPARHWLFLGSAQAAGSKEDQDKAEESFRRAIEADARLALAHYELGKWQLKNQEFAAAEASLERAIQLDPHLLGAYYQYGIACTRNGKTQKGQELMAAFQQKKALREAPPHAMPERELLKPQQTADPLPGDK